MHLKLSNSRYISTGTAKVTQSGRYIYSIRHNEHEKKQTSRMRRINGIKETLRFNGNSLIIMHQQSALEGWKEIRVGGTSVKAT